VDILEAIAQQRIVPVLRNCDPDDAIATGRACAQAGMRVIELTQSIPDVGSAVRALVEQDDLIVGVGTVVEPDQVRANVGVGARFIVSYAFDERVVETALELGVAVIPGALTATEVARCRHAGASAVKLFPARLIEPSYLGDLRAVMPGIEFMVTGGIPSTAEGIRPWLDAGALAVGVGSALGSAGEDGADEVARRCHEVLEHVSAAERAG
jgi:2-dehydro-3-deoxyphosphogluconate aldolase/(4S)-4-hydroxy-2-oxoglutarate aldolase